MENKKTMAFGVYRSPEAADQGVDRLIRSGYPRQDISVLLSDERTPEKVVTKGTKPNKTGMGIATGGVIGATLGLLAGAGALMIPGFGLYFAAGPILDALAGLVIGGATGGVIGALVGLGFPEKEARRYEEHIRSGRVFVSVHCNTPDDVGRVRDILKHTDAEDISSVGESPQNYFSKAS